MLTAEQKAAFKLLGVRPTDDPATIRRAWRALVRTYHPDQFRGDKAGANARLAELNAAYDVVEAFQPPKTVKTSANARKPSERKAKPKARAHSHQKTGAPKPGAQSKPKAQERRTAPKQAPQAPAPIRMGSAARTAHFGFSAARRAMSLAAQKGSVANFIA